MGHVCLSDEELRLYRTGHLPIDELPRVAQHLQSCVSCSTRMTNTSGGGADTMAADLPKLERRIAQWAQNQASSGSAGSLSAGPDRKPTPGIEIEGYRVTREIARGGMGIIYDAVQLKLNRRVALKVLPATLGAAGEQAVSRFRHEAAAAAKLHHTHIVPIYDFGQSGHTYYYAMELIDGLPLAEMIRRFGAANAHLASNPRLAELFDVRSSPVVPGQRSEPESTMSSSGTSFGSQGSSRTRVYYLHVARWIADAADALHYAHSQGIIHRDIKPGNLLLASDGRIMILDFGLAKSMNEMSVTTTGSLLGTLRYMSPEQAMAKRMKVDHRTDIYSLGATLYELLVFQPAYQGADEKETLGLIITKDATKPRKIIPQVPHELETICLKTLEKDPASRYQTAKDMAEDLRRFIQDLPIVAKPVGPVGRALKFVRRRRAASLAVFFGVFAILAGVFSIRIINELRLREKRNRARELMKSAIESIVNRDWERGRQTLQEVVQLTPDDPQALVNNAILLKDQYYSSRDRAFLSEALTFLDRAMEIDPKNTQTLNTLGVVYRILGRFDEAIDAHRRAISVRADFFPNYVNLATAYVAKNDLREAERELQEATRVEKKGRPTDRPAKEYEYYAIMAWHNLAAVQFRREQPDCSIAIDEALFINRADTCTKLLQARILLKHGKFRDARDAASAAFQNAKPHEPIPLILRTLALAELRRGDIAEAVARVRDAIAKKDTSPQAHFILAIALARSGEFDNAREQLAAGSLLFQENPKDSVNTQGFLWFESASEAEALQKEAESELRNSTPPTTTRP